VNVGRERVYYANVEDALLFDAEIRKRGAGGRSSDRASIDV
jgi:hypothetical protein